MSHVTLEEILSQPSIWRKVLECMSKDRSNLTRYLEQAVQKEFVFIGCGSSFYLSLSAANIYAIITGQKARAATASDVVFFPEAIFTTQNHRYMPVLVSRSGETTEMIRAIGEIQRRFREQTFGVSCRPHSNLIRLCTYPLVVPEADEQSVVMTRSFTSMLLLIQVLAAVQAADSKFEEELFLLPDHGAAIITKYHDFIKEIINDSHYTRFVYLGQGPYFGLACEGMLKIKEMSLSSSEAYHTLEFRHGPMSLADENMLSIFLISDPGRAQEIRLLHEMNRLGVHTLVITEQADEEIRKSADYIVELNSSLSEIARFILNMPVIQLLGYYNAIAKGVNPDQPKNLTQVVTL